MLTEDWKKSSHSGWWNDPENQNCVEARKVPGGVQVRHSTLEAGMITYSDAEWKAFLAGVRGGEFDIS